MPGVCYGRVVKTVSEYQYLLVISPGPLVMVRVPIAGKRGRRKHTMRWRELLKAATAVMREHGLRRRDISSIENYVTPDEWDPDPETEYPSKNRAQLRSEALERYRKIGRAFDDGIGFEKFFFYDWHDGTFNLVRRGADDFGS